MMLYLHNPPNLTLPPLLIEKTQAREEMEQSPTVYSFIKSNLLLDPKFHKIFMDINKKSEEIEELILLFKEEFPFARHKMRIPISGISISQKDYIKFRPYFYSHGPHFRIKGKKETQEYNKFILSAKTETYKKIITQIKRRSSESQSTLSRFEQTSSESLEILTISTLYICKKCHNILSTNRFTNITCACGAKISHISDIRKEPIAFFDTRLRNFILNNYWFEHGIDLLLRKKNFQTLCGVHVLGHSGCMHEIDNIAESKTSNFRIFGECKTSDIKTNDIFVLAGKMADIGCSRAYMFTLTDNIQKEIMHLARSRNISIINGIMNRPISELIKEIKED